MKRYVLHIIPLFLGLLFAGCLSELDGPLDKQRGSFSLGLSADSMTVEVETRAGRELTDAEKASFTVSLLQADEMVWADIPYADVSLADRTQPVGNSYVVTAQSCTSEEAESQNEGWGQRRYFGQSASFAIVKNEDTPVTVACSMANAGLMVDFDESFTSFFTMGYSVTLVDERGLEFNSTTTGRVAYYNVSADGTHSVRLLVNASAGWDGMLKTIDRTLTLQQGRVYRLHIRKGESEPLGTMGISITYDSAFDEGTTEDIELD